MTSPEPLACAHCGKALVGRQIKWCSLGCKRDHDSAVALIEGIATNVRKCKDCGLLKPLAVDFYELPGGRHRRSCRTCVMAGNTRRQAAPDKQDKARERHLQSLYGISAAQYEEMLTAQGGGCAVCRKPPIRQRLSVDHDHRTLLVRGLLCGYCNLRVIGKHTSADTLRSAFEYLENPPALKVLGEHAVPSNRPAKKRRPRRTKVRAK